MPKLRRLLHFALPWLLVAWLGMATAVRAGSLPDCCEGAGDTAPCCLLAAGGCAMTASCPGAPLPAAFPGTPAPRPQGPGWRPVSDAVVLPVRADEIWRPPDRA